MIMKRTLLCLAVAYGLMLTSIGFSEITTFGVWYKP